jgi:hypothetical protein
MWFTRVASVICLGDTVFPVQEVYWGMRKLLERLGSERPLLVNIEDAHWAEAAASRLRERLPLLDLDVRVQERVHRGELPLRSGLLLVPLRDQARQRRLANHAVRRRLTVVQVRRLVETALALPPPPMSAAPLPPDDEPNGGGSLSRLEALDALRAQLDRTITFGQLATLVQAECCACGPGSAPAICAECPNLHLLQAVLRQQPSHAA